jgi:hypothetical protein
MSTETYAQSADTKDDDWWVVSASARSLYANQIIRTATRVGKRARLFRFALSHVTVQDGQYLEFGVHEGKDIVRMAAFVAATRSSGAMISTNTNTKNKVNIIFHGFDSFHGLPEDWDNGQRDEEGLKFKSGTFGLDGVAPNLDSVQQELNLGKFQSVEKDNIVLHPGWFEDTVPAFFDTHDSPIAFVHADADLYRSTLIFLDEMCKRRLLVRGSVIVFDEFTNYENWEQGEYRAWTEVCHKYHIDFEYVCYHAPGPNDRRNTFGYQSVGIVVTRVSTS